MTKASSKRKSQAKKPSKASTPASTNPSATPISNTNPNTPNKATTPATPKPSTKASPFTITIHHPTDHPPLFIIRPTSIWESLTRYRACEVATNQIPLSASITLTRPSHPGLWTAHILEIRASDPTHVYLRLYYYLHPSHLPAPLSDENYPWGESELIATNEMEIVHAEHILAAVEVVHYRGLKERYPGDGGTLWWRRAYDVVGGESVGG